MDQEECDGVETEGDVGQVQDPQLETAGVSPSRDLLGRSVDVREISHTEVCQTAGTPAPQLHQGGTALADDPQYVVVHEATEVQSHQTTEVPQTLADDVEIMFQEVVRVRDIVVITGDRVVVQAGDVEMLQVFQPVQTVQHSLVSVGERPVGTLSSW